MKYVIWNSIGEILHRCDDEDEFDTLMEEYSYEELSRTHHGREINVCGMEYF